MDITTFAIPAASALFGGAVTLAVNALREGGNYKFQALCLENQEPIHKRINELKTVVNETRQDVAVIKARLENSAPMNGEMKELLQIVREMQRDKNEND